MRNKSSKFTTNREASPRKFSKPTLLSVEATLTLPRTLTGRRISIAASKGVDAPDVCSEAVDLVGPGELGSPRKTRAASKGVALFVQGFKAKRKIQVEQGKKKGITCRAVLKISPFYFTVVYGCNEGIARRSLCAYLQGVYGSIGSSPWVLLGDFNAIHGISESSVPTLGVTYDMLEFQHGLFDIEEGMPLDRKHDRVLTNATWYNLFPHSKVEFLAPGVSDHSLVL
ncbi:hypothetical protein V6N13_009052 [Hibiscus sabdariffa]